jgi:hypothetical protein
MIRYLLLGCFAFCFCINVSAVAICHHNLGDTTVQLLAKDSLKIKKNYRAIIEKSLGRKLDILERIELFCIGKRAFVTALPIDEQIKLANNTIDISFWLALASFILPSSMLFSLLYKNSFAVNRLLLTEKSKRRLKFIVFMEKFWSVVFLLLIILFVYLAVSALVQVFADLFNFY